MPFHRFSRMPLHSRILLGLVLGALAGIATNLLTGGGPGTERFVTLVTQPIGKLWLSCLIMVVIPLIVSSLAVGVANLGDLRKLGRIGAVTLLGFLCLTALATALGLATMNVLRPGDNLDPTVKARLMENLPRRGRRRDGALGQNLRHGPAGEDCATKPGQSGSRWRHAWGHLLHAHAGRRAWRRSAATGPDRCWRCWRAWAMPRWP